MSITLRGKTCSCISGCENIPVYVELTTEQIQKIRAPLEQKITELESQIDTLRTQCLALNPSTYKSYCATCMFLPYNSECPEYNVCQKHYEHVSPYSGGCNSWKKQPDESKIWPEAK